MFGEPAPFCMMLHSELPRATQQQCSARACPGELSCSILWCICISLAPLF